jgi:hypothetical protein
MQIRNTMANKNKMRTPLAVLHPPLCKPGWGALAGEDGKSQEL